MNSRELRELLSRFPKEELALNPTPLHPLKRMQDKLGCGPLFIKRDDLNGIGIGGNKVRNLEYLLGDAAAQGKEHIVLETARTTPGSAALYRALGYRETDYYGSPAGVENCLCFEKDIEETNR